MAFATPARSGAAVAALALLLTACGGTAGNTASSSATAADTRTSSSGASASTLAGVTVTDTWVKAIPDVKAAQMTGVFGKITNSTDKPITIVSGKNSVSELTELHETVMKDAQKVMQPVKEGFTIEAGKTRELKPGGDHVMIMKMTKALKPGDEVTITLNTKDNQAIAFTAVAKTFVMGNEPYVSGSPSS